MGHIPQSQYGHSTVALLTGLCSLGASPEVSLDSQRGIAPGHAPQGAENAGTVMSATLS